MYSNKTFVNVWLIKRILSLIFKYFYKIIVFGYFRMKIYSLIVFLVLISFSATAQFEATKKKINISAQPEKASKKKASSVSENKKTTAPVIKFESQYLNKSEDKLLKQFSNVPKIGEVTTKPSYEIKNSSEIYTEKVKEKLESEGLSQQIVNSDIYLGEFIVFTEQLNVNCRDYGAIDGDNVRIWLNNEIVTKDIFLEGGFKSYDFLLKEGLNIIQIEALNTGDFFPNTGQFVFYDGNSKLVTNQNWGLNAGFKAVIKIVRLKGISPATEEKQEQQQPQDSIKKDDP